MTSEALKGALEPRTFRPFRIVFADGRSVHVPHPDFVSISPSEPRTVIVHKSGGGFHILDLTLTSDLDFTPLT
jgi:hypothetical protein